MDMLCFANELIARRRSMKLQLTEFQKYEMLEIDVKELRDEIKKRILTSEMYSVKENELDIMQKAISNSIELEVDTEVPEENTKLSFYTHDNRVVVIRRKQFSIKLFWDLMNEAITFQAGNDITRVWTVLRVIFKVFFSVLDEDVSFVYSCICKEYFTNGNKISNLDIFDEVNKYVRQNLGGSWPNDKINKTLLELEKLKVIAFENGFLDVKDKIYFG